MTLAVNALSSVASLRAYMQRPVRTYDLMSVYHDGTDSISSATVEVTATGITLTSSTGTPTTSTLAFSSYTTISAMVTAINALADDSGNTNWFATIRRFGNEPSASLVKTSSTSCLLIANEQFIAGTDDGDLENSITQATSIIESFCGRQLYVSTYSHLHSGSATQKIALRNWPVVSVTRVAVGVFKLAQLVNTSTDATYATASCTSTLLTLTVAGGTNSSTNTLSITTYTTLSTLAVAVTALNKGWTLTPTEGLSAYLSSEIVQFNGINCLTTPANLYGANEPDVDFTVDENAGVLYRGSRGASTFYPLVMFVEPVAPPIRTLAGAVWPMGNFNILVEYTGGYSTIPAALEMAANELAASILRTGAKDQTLMSESAAGYSYTNRGEGYLTDAIKQRLMQYRSPMARPFIDA